MDCCTLHCALHAKETRTFRGHYYASVKNVIPIKNRRFLLRICSGALISFYSPVFFPFFFSFFLLERDRRQSFPFYSKAFYFEHFYPLDSACKIGRRYLKIQSSSLILFFVGFIYIRIIYVSPSRAKFILHRFRRLDTRKQIYRIDRDNAKFLLSRFSRRFFENKYSSNDESHDEFRPNVSSVKFYPSWNERYLVECFFLLCKIISFVN